MITKETVRQALLQQRCVQAGWAFGVPVDGREQWLDLVAAAIAAMPGPWESVDWYRAIDPDGEIWCEASDKEDVIERMRPGDHLERQYRRTEEEWRFVVT